MAFSDPRIEAALFTMAQDIGEMKASYKNVDHKVGEIHKALYGNGRAGVLDRLLIAENKITTLLGHSIEKRKHTLKVVGWTTGATQCIILAIKLVYFLTTKEWPNIP